MIEGDGTQGATTRPTAFLSYSHADQERVRLLAAALEQAGITVWWDTLIEGGAEFAKSVEVALARCDAVVVAWSKVSVASNWVLDEAGQGRDLRKLVPVSLDGTLPPLGFRQFLSVDLTGWRGESGARQIADRRARHRGGHGPHATGGICSHGAMHLTHAPPPAPTFSRRAAAADRLGHGRRRRGRPVCMAHRPHRRLYGRGFGNSVAVLPFKNISGDEGQDYFSDGLSEELRATLARNLKLRSWHKPRPRSFATAPRTPSKSPRSSASPTCSTARCASRATSHASPPT